MIICRANAISALSIKNESLTYHHEISFDSRHCLLGQLVLDLQQCLIANFADAIMPSGVGLMITYDSQKYQLRRFNLNCIAVLKRMRLTRIDIRGLLGKVIFHITCAIADFEYRTSQACQLHQSCPSR